MFVGRGQSKNQSRITILECLGEVPAVFAVLIVRSGVVARELLDCGRPVAMHLGLALWLAVVIAL